MSLFLSALADIDQAHHTERKLMLAPDLNYGRELLCALARRSGGWLGWEPVTLRGIAEEIAFVPLATARRRAADDVEVTALLDRAFDVCLAQDRLDAEFAKQGAKLGVRAAVRDAVLALRMARVTSAMVRRAAAPESPAGQLPAVMDEFTARLDASGLVDPAGLFECALQSFDAEAPFVIDGIIVAVPGRTPRGLLGRLFERLRDTMLVLPDAAAEGSPFAPGTTPVLFHAASPEDELREVLRRVLAEKALTWDQIEIVTTDPDTYGVALHGLALRCGIPLTALDGVPMARTRTGRAVSRVLEWMEAGLPADLLREALECGELVPVSAPSEPDAPDGLSLSRTLRSLSIGWGRKRFEAALKRLRDGSYVAGQVEQREDETPESADRRRAIAEAEAKALGALIEQLLAILPAEVPERNRPTQPVATPAGLASAALAYLEMVPAQGAGEFRARERHLSRLRRLAAVTDEPPQPFKTALAVLRESLADLRAWPLALEGGSPWSSSGGALHLTNLDHAGTTGRPHVFVVGLDADRIAGSRLQDPILTDRVRRSLNDLLGHAALATTADRLTERRAGIRRALGRLTGHVTLSYAVASSVESGQSGPSWVMLEALRCEPASRTAGFEDLRKRLGEPASPVPGAGLALDERDVWLGELAAGALLLDGREAVLTLHSDLARGMAAAEARAGSVLTVHHGFLPEAAGRFDPVRAGKPISPSSLERLAACPLKWFYHYGLKLRLPEDLEYDPECWIDAAKKGGLLHRVFERFVQEYRARQDEVAGDEARRRLEEITQEEVLRQRTRIPPPGEAVFEAEVRDILEIARGFLQLEREQAVKAPGSWYDAEYEYGEGERAVALPLPGQPPLQLEGKIDRIDRLANGTLRVIDYKTGSAAPYVRSSTDAPLKGGRTLQAALYAHAAATLLGAEVSTSEYWFPKTARPVAYGRPELAECAQVVVSLLEHPQEGTFVPTIDSGACRFCDFAQVCRTKPHERYPTAESSLADWAREHAGELDAYAGLLLRNTPREPGDG